MRRFSTARQRRASWPELRRLALTDLEESIKLDPDQSDAQYMLGRLNALPGGDRKRGREGDGCGGATDRERTGRLRQGTADPTSHASEDDEQRLADYDQAITLTPRSAEAIRSRGMFYLLKDKLDLALADLDKAIELDPTSADAFEAKGVAQFMMKEYDAPKPMSGDNRPGSLV